MLVPLVTAKHQTPEYRRNAKLRRQQVEQAHRRGEPVACWRCRGLIHPGQPYDIGHLTHGLTSDLEELAPEHRHRNSRCVGNRSAGGKIGASVTNRRHVAANANNATTWKV
jgi:hypothetical protein